MTRIALEALTKRYGAVTAVDELTLAMADRRITALLGPSGCGKSTTLKLIAGLIRPTAGRVTFDGRDVAGVPAERRGAVMVFQHHLLFPYLDVGDNVGFGLRMRGVPRGEIRRRVLAMLDRVGLPDVTDRRPHELSGGQQQRVALARALVVEPEVLLLDEPLANLDTHLRDGMRELILDVQRELAVTTVVVTHDQEEAVVLADEVAVLLDGRLAQRGVPRDLYERPASEQVARFLGAGNLVAARRDGAEVATPLGRLHAPHGTALDDGPVCVVVRPEAIVVGDTGGPNVVRGRVRDARYLGTRGRVSVAVGEGTLTVVTPPEALRLLVPGSEVPLTLPPEALWSVPADAAAGSPAAAPRDVAVGHG
jgi:ABC-type Fe3+/spermidine/putrescine transport system ATPase subunit